MHLPSPHNYQSILYKTIDADQLSNDNETLRIKKSQMISTIMDTIQEKSANPDKLKRSLRKFDQQYVLLNIFARVLTMYDGSTKSQTLVNNDVSQNSNYMSSHSNNYYTRPPIHTYHSINTSNNLSKRHHSQQKTTKPHYQSTKKLSIPKPNTLTDKFMKQVLGSQQQLIDQYDRTVNPAKYQQQTREQMMNNVKEEWKKNAMMQTHHYTSSNRNVFRFNENGSEMQNRDKAFFDEDYYNYLKTNMKYLAQLNSNNSNNTLSLRRHPLTSEFRTKINNQFSHPFQQPKPQNINNHHYDNNLLQQSYFNQQPPHSPFLQKEASAIVRKIQQTGGIENTIQKMQRSLKKNELKHLKDNQYLNRKQQTQVVKQRDNPRRGHQISTINYSNNETTAKMTKNMDQVLEQKLQINPKTISTSYLNYNKPNSNTQQNFINSPNNNNCSNSNWRQKSQSMRKRIQKSIDKK